MSDKVLNIIFGLTLLLSNDAFSHSPRIENYNIDTTQIIEGFPVSGKSILHLHWGPPGNEGDYPEIDLQVPKNSTYEKYNSIANTIYKATLGASWTLSEITLPKGTVVKFGYDDKEKDELFSSFYCRLLTGYRLPGLQSESFKSDNCELSFFSDL